MKELLTIIIPCKNEKDNIYECLGFVSKQSGIAGTRVIIADCSDEEGSIWWLWKAITDFKYSLNIEIIPGGFPAKARLEGSKLVTTPYLLFLDADIMLRNKYVLGECLAYNANLITTPFETEKGYNWIFRLFDIQQRLSQFFKSPFAVGGFQFWKTEAYWKYGGFNETHLFAEDYALSSKEKDMKVHKTKGVWTSARRFKKKGFLYMLRLSALCYINRNNPEFFKKHHNYWT
jgi:glycosyltransferase involved in cell wall biosynthesis